MTSPPLAGVRVLDLGRYISAPYCTMLLADLGAEVIRVERPGGDDDRRIGWTTKSGETPVFAGLGRNKLGVTLDIRQERGRQVLRDLIAHCDVCVHNFSPGAARSFGLSYDGLRAVRVDLIYAALSSFGQHGPHADRLGFDPIAQMASGAAAVTGYEHEPLRAGVPWVDYTTGQLAAFAIVVALRHRDKTGDGQQIDCSLLQSALSVTAPIIAEATLGGRDRPRLGNRVAYLGPCDLYRCIDGYVYVAAATDAMWRALMKTIGRSDLLETPGLTTDLERFEQRARIDPLVAAWMAERRLDEAMETLIAARVPCGVYSRPHEVPDDPQVRSQRMLASVDDGFEQVPVTPHPIKYSSISARSIERAPRPGEHNELVFGSMLHYSPDVIAELRSGCII